jgi:peroxiredoxin Q/BCP
MKAFASVTLLLSSFVSLSAYANSIKVGDTAPTFSLKTQDGKDFNLDSRRGKGWTVLFFYPKAGTPGCTKQACAFRDSVKVIRAEGAEVYGISADSSTEQAKFHAEHKLSFDLIADPDAQAIEKYGVKMKTLNLAKRWTFILDPELKVRSINENVDPAMDAQKVSQELVALKATAKK